jgi:peptidoglycan-associated lipoprotein
MNKLLLLAVSATLLAGCGGKPSSEAPIKPVAPVANKEDTPPPAESNNKLEGMDLTSPDAYNRQGVLKTVYFDSDKSDLRDSEQAVLNANTAWLKAHSQFNVLLEGNCDEQNTEEYNLALGQQRADQVKQFLSSHGIFVSRIRTLSYGEDRPVDPGHNEAAWQKNRRVDFKLIAK